MIDLKDRRSQVTLGVVLMAIGLAGYRFVVARPVYGPSSVGIDVAAQNVPAPDLVEDRAAPVRSPGSSGATQSGRLLGDFDVVAEDHPEASDSQKKKVRKGRRGGRKRNSTSADQEKNKQEKKTQGSSDVRKRGAPFRKAPSGL